jgi:hypothetical protein
MWPRLTREMTASARPSGSNGFRGGGHGLSAGRGGARHESPRRDSAGLSGKTDVDPSRGDPGPQRPQHAAAAVEVRALWRRGALRPTPAYAVPQARASGRGATPVNAVPGAVSGLQRPAFSSARSAPARGALLLCLREEGATVRRAGGQAAAAGAPSPPPRAAAVLRRAAASGWQPASVAGAGSGAVVHHAGRGRRRHHTGHRCSTPSAVPGAKASRP